MYWLTRLQTTWTKSFWHFVNNFNQAPSIQLINQTFLLKWVIYAGRINLILTQDWQLMFQIIDTWKNVSKKNFWTILKVLLKVQISVRKFLQQQSYLECCRLLPPTALDFNVVFLLIFLRAIFGGIWTIIWWYGQLCNLTCNRFVNIQFIWCSSVSFDFTSFSSYFIVAY